MTAVQHEDGGAGPIRRLHGRPGSHTRPGRHRRHGGGALLVRENTMIACTPSGAALCNLTGAAAQLEDEVHKRPDARGARRLEGGVRRQGLGAGP